MFVSINLLTYACAAVLVCSLLLGGGTSNGFLSDAVLELLAIPLLLLCLWHVAALRPGKAMRRALIFGFAILLVPLLQLVPLPPAVWTALPSREPIAAAFGLLERELPWMPISVSPQATWLSALSLLPPLAIFIGTLLLGFRDRRLLSIVVLGVGVVSVFTGLSQVAQGPKSALRFFEFTNLSEAVGFFANRNHFAALLYALMLFAAAWAVEAAINFEAGRRKPDTAWIVGVVASFTILIVLVAAQAMARSRAGLGLTIVALFGAFALALADRRSTSGVTPTRLLAGATALAVVLAVQYALYRIMERFTADPLEDARIAFARNTITAAKAYMPFGSGMGTFVPVYATFEKPQDALVDTYANRAHNDILELWVEAGAVGLGLLVLFLAWLAIASVRVWRRDATEALHIDRSLARAATMIVGLIIAHSLVDYPLRTGAMMAIVAFACGLLVEPSVKEREAVADSGESQTRREAAAVPPAVAPSAGQPLPGLAAASPQHGGVRWGEGLDWPEEWRGDNKRRPTDAAMERSASRKPKEG